MFVILMFGSNLSLFTVFLCFCVSVYLCFCQPPYQHQRSRQLIALMYLMCMCRRTYLDKQGPGHHAAAKPAGHFAASAPAKTRNPTLSTSLQTLSGCRLADDARSRALFCSPPPIGLAEPHACLSTICRFCGRVSQLAIFPQLSQRFPFSSSSSSSSSSPSSSSDTSSLVLFFLTSPWFSSKNLL